jgi:predicted DNA-binding transcriptional regulator AlpA
MIDRLFDADVAAIIGVTQSTIRQHIRRGSMPAPDGFDGRKRWWSRSTIERWACERRRPGNPNFGAPTDSSRRSSV